MNREFILTEDGSHTLFVPEMGEHFHSVHGALRESVHIFIENGYKKINRSPLNILEVGFGTGLNAFLTLLESKTEPRKVYYETWEAYPLTPDEYSRLNYPAVLNHDPALLTSLHEAAWDSDIPVTPDFTLRKVLKDIRHFIPSRRYDLVYFDAFGPAYQPELWETAVFQSLSAAMPAGSLLVTYSAKGQVRRNLKEAGFLIEKAAGPPGKREITIAIKK